MPTTSRRDLPIPGSRPRRAGIVDELVRGQRFTVGVLLSVLLLSVVSSGYLLLVCQPRLSELISMNKLVRDAHEGMLDQETGLRGWLATGDTRFRDPYTTGRRTTAAASAALLRAVQQQPEATESLVGVRLRQERWQLWADEAAWTTYRPMQREDGTLADFLLTGKRLFDAYRTEETAARNELRVQREQALQRQREAMIATLGSFLALLGISAWLTVRRRRRLDSRVLQPLHDLHGTLEQLRSGDLSARAEASSVVELDEIGQALGGLADEVQRAGREAQDREDRLALLAERLASVVSIGREIAGSLSVRYVAATVSTAAADLLGARTTLWIQSEDDELRAAHRSQDAHGVTPPERLVPSALVRRAAAEATVVAEGHERAYPLVLGGEVIAVLETYAQGLDSLDGPRQASDEALEQVLTALLHTAAAALESARLHGAVRELADMDGLTQLPNRRRFEGDAAAEWERSHRYDRPLSMVMIDLDHFKDLNDHHGHLVGDEVLRLVAHRVSEVMRTTDTAYRYGGEEIVVLLRETGLDEAAVVAERLRAGIAATILPGRPGISVTASAGVGTRRPLMAHHADIVAVADQALYEAKRLGRNRVAIAAQDEDVDRADRGWADSPRARTAV